MVVRLQLPLIAALAALTALVGPQARAGTAIVDAQSQAVVVRDERSGVVSVVRGLSVVLPGDGAEAVRAWLTEHATEFGLEPGRDQLQVADVRSFHGDTRVRVRQLHDGIPVEGADAMAVLDADGRLRSVCSGYIAGLGAIAAPRVTILQARLAGLDASHAAGLPAAELVIARTSAGDRPVWRVTSTLEAGRPVVTRIDALTGVVLEADAGVVHAVGNVWPTDPRGAVEQRDLPGLLPGPGMVAHMLAISDQAQAPVSPDQYLGVPGSNGFDQVNTYWHAQHYFRDFMAPLGYAGPPDSVVIRIHAPIDPNVATTTGAFVYLGLPIVSFTQDACQSDDIIYHELTHTVIYGFGIQPGGTRREAGALHEAVADYFAAALTGDPALGEWAYLRFPTGSTRLDQPAPPWDYAHYDVVAFGGGGPSSVWGNSMILSSGLWDLRQRIGASCDSLVLEALAFLPTFPTWAQFATAMIDADTRNHGSRFGSDIVVALSHRLIHGSAVAGINGPDLLRPKTIGLFTATPCCGGPQGTYHWRSRPWLRGAPVGDWRDLGDGDTLRTEFTQDSQLSLIVNSPWGDVLEATKLVTVTLPTLTVDGPTRLVQHHIGTWTARADAVGPVTLKFERQYRRVGAPKETLVGTSEARTFAADTSFDLNVTLVDGVGRATGVHLFVQTIRDQPPPSSRTDLAVRVRVDAARHQVETGIELLRASDLKAVVYDVRGSARVHLWQGPAAAGEFAIRWDDSQLEPGVYFLHVEAGAHEARVRFVVLH